MGRILSGIQPTGNIHLGNYLGAIKNWVSLQNQHDCYFCLVDLHALTTRPDPADLHESTLMMAASYVAAGIDPHKSVIFPQSAVAAHAELMWILSCHTSLGWLNRMTQFKEKSGKTRDQAVLGLFAYPVLMAADILLYQATDVPVGDDQKQHVELTRDIAISFNNYYGKPVFQIPTPRILGQATRVMSLRDGMQKMSKSDPAEGARIGLFDHPDEIAKKIRKAKTDMLPFPDVYDDALNQRPEVKNLINIYAALENSDPAAVCQKFSGGNFAPFKEALTDVCLNVLHPFQARYRQIISDKAQLLTLLKEGTERAASIAHQTLDDVKKTVGLVKI